MRFLFLRFPLESAHGGAEEQTRLLWKGLLERGHTVSFVGSCPVLYKQATDAKIEAHRLDIGPPPVTKREALRFLWKQFAMRRALLEFLDHHEECDALVMLSLSEKLLLTKIAAARGKKVFWIEHDSIGRWLTRSPWLPLLRKQSRDATIIVVSDLSARIYRQLGFDTKRIVSVPNGIEEPIAGTQHAQTHVPLHVGCISRLSHEKGVDNLIRAIAPLPGVTLEIIGKGPEEQRLLSLTQELQVEQRVQFVPFVDSLEPAYARFDVLVLPSRRHDPFGLVVAEAMLRGIPTVVTQACGIAAHMAHGTDAMIVPPDSAPALSQAISGLIDPVRRESMARHGMQTAQQKFVAKKMVDRYEDVFTGKAA